MKEFVFKTNTIFLGGTDRKYGQRSTTAITLRLLQSILNIVSPFRDTIKDALIQELLIHGENMQVLRCAELKHDPGQHQGETVGHGEGSYAHYLVF